MLDVRDKPKIWTPPRRPIIWSAREVSHNVHSARLSGGRISPGFRRPRPGAPAIGGDGGGGGVALSAPYAQNHNAADYLGKAPGVGTPTATSLIVFLVNADDVTTTRGVGGQHNHTTQGAGMRVTGGVLQAIFNNGAVASNTSTITVSTGSWQYWGMYFNGALNSSVAYYCPFNAAGGQSVTTETLTHAALTITWPAFFSIGRLVGTFNGKFAQCVHFHDPTDPAGLMDAVANEGKGINYADWSGATPFGWYEMQDDGIASAGADELGANDLAAINFSPFTNIDYQVAGPTAA